MRFFPISLKNLSNDFLAPCDLYRETRRKFVLFARKGIPIRSGIRSQFLESGLQMLYAREQDAFQDLSFLQENLLSAIHDPDISTAQKAAVVHASCRGALQNVYKDPRATFLNQAFEILSPAIDLIISNDETIRCMMQLTAYDHSTYNHSTNVGIFSIALAKNFLGPDAEKDLSRLSSGFFLHDLGKCKIPKEILNKPGPLTPAERLIVNQHPRDGYNMLNSTGLMSEEAKIITLQHHEREDGTGYPQGLKGSEIHPYARICRIADVYEALTAKRPYHQARSTFEALKLMKEEVLDDMDQEIFGYFINLFTPDRPQSEQKRLAQI